MNTLTSLITELYRGRLRTAYLLKMLVLLILPVIIISCKASKTTLKLNTEIITPLDCKKLDITVGYYHSPEFLAFKDSIVNYWGSGEISFVKIFPLGTSSDVLFKSIYPKVFDSVMPVNATAGNADKEIDFILKPEIASFRYSRDFFYPTWAEIIYLYTLYSPDGKELASWTIVGWGEKYYSKHPYQAAVDKAMENATIKFINSFDQVPEVKRCLNGLSPEGLTVTPEMLDTVMIPQGADSTLTSAYKGLVSARIKCEFINRVPLRNKNILMDTIGVTSIQVFLKNEGSDKLFLDPLNISWTPIGKQEVYPVSSTAFTERDVERIYPSDSFDELGWESLIIDLLFSYNDPIPYREYLNRSNYFFSREALLESTIDSNTSVTGSIYFPALPDTPDSGELEIPIINLDTATRYIIRFKIQKDTKIKEINFHQSPPMRKPLFSLARPDN